MNEVLEKTQIKIIMLYFSSPVAYKANTFTQRHDLLLTLGKLQETGNIAAHLQSVAVSVGVQ